MNCGSSSTNNTTCSANFAADLSVAIPVATGTCTRDSDCAGYTTMPTYYAGCAPTGPSKYVTCASGKCINWLAGYTPVKSGSISSLCLSHSLPTKDEAQSFCNFVTTNWTNGQCPAGFNPPSGCFPALMENSPGGHVGFQILTSDGTFHPCSQSVTQTLGYALCIN